MSDRHIATDDAWVPDACTLPTAERPLRLVEWDRFFTDAVRGMDRLSARHLRLHLDGAARVEEMARDLTARESSCCSFFTFGLSRSGPDSLALDIRVPAAHVDVLDALTAGRVSARPEVTGSGLRSGQLADAAGVNQQTLRYYERRGLLDPPQRSPGGHRLYPAETVTLLRVIKTAQRLGFTLNEVADLLDAGRHRHRGRPDTGLQARAREKLVEIEQRLADLTVIRDTLRDAILAGCDDLIACADSTCCPLPFAALAEHRQAGSRAH